MARLIDGTWRLRAACQSADPGLFFAVSSAGKSLEQVAEATAVRLTSRLRGCLRHHGRSPEPSVRA